MNKKNNKKSSKVDNCIRIVTQSTCKNVPDEVHLIIEKIISVVFFATDSGNEPVKDFLKKIKSDDRKIIGNDIKKVEYGWPLGMPTCKKLEKDLWEVRTDITDGNIARVFFTVVKNEMYLLHAVIKKTQKTAKQDLELARSRKNKVLL